MVGVSLLALGFAGTSWGQIECLPSHPAVTEVRPGSCDLDALARDCEVLLNLGEALKGTETLNWSIDTNMQDWEGVELNDDRSRVEEIELGHRSPKLNGSIADLTGLTALTTLRLNDNRLTGSLPSLSGLTELQYFNVARQNLTGRLPAMTGLTKLEWFNAEENRLTGPIPDLSGLVEMDRFDVSDNALTGPIPDLSGLVELEKLILGNVKRNERGFGNRFEEPIPSLDEVVALRQLRLNDAGLTGEFPDLTALTNLTHLHIGNNRLTGSFPAIGGSNLEEVEAQNNLFTGTLPDLRNHTGMNNLYLSWNGFTGDSIEWLDFLGGLDELSMCFTGLDTTLTLPAATESRRSGGNLTMFGCLRIDADVEADEGTDLAFNVTHSTWPVRQGGGLYVSYRTVDQTATTLDYSSTLDAVVTVPAMGADEFMKSAAITLPAYPDTENEFDETFLVELIEAYELAPAGAPQGANPGNVLPKDARWTATGTILDAAPPPPPGTGPGPGPAPDPDPEPDPDPDPDPAACDRLVAPYWRGDGGIAVRPKNGRSAVFRHTCRGAQTTETLYANEAGLIVQLLSRDACTDDAGKVISVEVSVEGAEDGGWYWIEDAANSAVAPLLCEVQLGGSRATVPAGVSTDVTTDATLFEHHGSRLLGIVPHLQTPDGGACSAYVAPYWKGTGGMVVSATDGESAQLTNTCGGISKTQTLKANDDGLIVQLLGEGDSASDASTCNDGAGKVLRSDVSIAGVEPGGWYWINGDRNSAVAPLACADQLGGSRATVPAGVDADATAAGTLFEHHVTKLIGIVPHLRRD